MTPLETTLAAGLAVAVAFVGILSWVCRDQDRRITDLIHANDWQARLLARRSRWRQDRPHDTPNKPHAPRLWRHDPPR